MGDFVKKYAVLLFLVLAAWPYRSEGLVNRKLGCDRHYTDIGAIYWDARARTPIDTVGADWKRAIEAGGQFLDRRFSCLAIAVALIAIVPVANAKTTSSPRTVTTDLAPHRKLLIEGVQPRPAKTYVVTTIDGQPFTLGQVLSDFLEVAFQDNVWNEDRGQSQFERHLNQLEAGTKSQRLRQSIEKHLHWMSPYHYREEIWPKSGVINKWPDEISIAIETVAGRNARSNKITMEEVVRSLLPALTKAIGRNVSFIESDFLRNQRPVAGIHILLQDGVIQERPDDGQFWHEPGMWGGVMFGDSDNMSVRGYLLPDSHNNVGLAVCKIQSWVTEPILRSLVARCVLRAMGLPGVTERKVTTMLDRPNLAPPPGLDKLRHASKPPFDTPSSILSAYDLKMLSLLYCPAIQSGMSKNEVIQILAAKKECAFEP